MKAQAGICAEPNLHALYLMFNRTGDAAALTSRGQPASTLGGGERRLPRCGLQRSGRRQGRRLG
jgi:hypothetical protein